MGKRGKKRNKKSQKIKAPTFNHLSEREFNELCEAIPFSYNITKIKRPYYVN